MAARITHLYTIPEMQKKIDKLKECIPSLNEEKAEMTHDVIDALQTILNGRVRAQEIAQKVVKPAVAT
jgi:peptidoglycan hydrolase CwlO-like protein